MTISYKELRATLEHHGLWAKKSHGQHFLHQKNILHGLKALIKENTTSTKILWEIGPGPGSLTKELFDLQQEGHIEHIHCIEKDEDMAPLLQGRFPTINFQWQDALTLDWNDLKDATIVGNLPYNISVPLMLSYGRYSHNLGPGIFMIQKEVAQRLCASPGSSHYGRLSVMIQCFCDVSLAFLVPPGAFFPQPAVDSAVVVFKPNKFKHQGEESMIFFPKLESLVALAFSQRRKQILNTLKPLFPEKTKEEFGHWLKELDIDPKERAENLTIDAFCNLVNKYLKDKNNI